MNRKQKIIISVTGIFVVLLILVGLTYAYFLTRINGNTNTKSISASTKYLSVTYVDGTNTIATATGIGPSSTPVITKDFSVRNDGEDTSYVVTIENIDIKDKNNNDTTFNSNDFTYVLECTNSDDSSSCNDMGELKLPLSNGALSFNTIEEGVTQNFTLKVYYKETGVDQSSDMGKTISAKINISNGNDLTKLSDVIKLNNSPISTTRPNFAVSPTRDEGLIQEESSYGKTYYFRGPVEDNYVSFGTYQPSYMVGFTPESGFANSYSTYESAVSGCQYYTDYEYSSQQECVSDIKENTEEKNQSIIWRIVRINEDGSIRLMLDKGINNNYSYNYSWDNPSEDIIDLTYNNSVVKYKLNEWNQIHLNSLSSFISNTSYYCNDDVLENNYINLILNFSCKNKINANIGLITTDEAIYSGMKYGESSVIGNESYMNNKGGAFTMNYDSYYGNNIYMLEPGGGYSIFSDYINSYLLIRPVINLKADILYNSGDGTINNPYTIK